MLLYISIAGGIFAVTLLISRRILMSLKVRQMIPGGLALPRVLLEGEAIPYGVAIAIGAIMLGNQLPLLGQYL